MSGHWKLWHDMSGRFIVAACLVVWQVYATSGPLSIRNRSVDVTKMSLPAICMDAAAAPDLKIWEGPSARRNYAIQAESCRPGEKPNPSYARAAHDWVRGYDRAVWRTTMPVLMLFIGILLGVGAPFSGESAEAAALTFSLPWSRRHWLRRKMEMTGGLVAGLVAFVFVSGRILYQLPGLGVLHGLEKVAMPGVFDAVPAFVAGIAGVTFGITATLLTRNALAGAISASLAAYLLGLVDWSQFREAAPWNDTLVVMDFTTPSGVFIAVLVIAGAVALTCYRLEQTDF